MRRNRFFKVDTRGRSASDLEKALQEIVDKVGNEDGLPLGALTSENRDVWAEVSWDGAKFSLSRETRKAWRRGNQYLTDHG